jgi:hypothetical protein
MCRALKASEVRMFWFKPRRPTVAQSSNTNPIADRTAILLDGVEKHHLGLEIGPWHSPLVPKSAGSRTWQFG